MLSLNVKRTSILFLTNLQKQYNIPLRPPNLNINRFTVDRESLVKFSVFCVDENLTWRDHIHTVLA